LIKEGKVSEAKYWGKFTVKKVLQLETPVKCNSAVKGDALFHPTLVRIEWEKAPSEDKNEFWFPYWMTLDGKEKYGQFAPMIGEKALLELLQKAIKEDFFSQEFLTNLKEAINNKIR
jgi:hypothetical protein